MVMSGVCGDKGDAVGHESQCHLLTQDVTSLSVGLSPPDKAAREQSQRRPVPTTVSTGGTVPAWQHTPLSSLLPWPVSF